MNLGRRRALWDTLLWLAVGLGSYLLGVRNVIGQQAEASVLDAAAFTTDPPPPLNLVSVPTIGLALVVLGLLALWAHGAARAVLVVLMPALAIVAAQLLKVQILTRPQLFELDADNTFPSGHMTVFAALATALVWAVPARLRALAALFGAVLLGVVGWQLLAYGWHRPSDVLGGLALGVLAFTIACLVQPERRLTRPAAQGRSVGRGAALVLSVLGWVLVAIALVLAGAAGWRGSSDLMLVAGEIGVCGGGALAMRTMLNLIARYRTR